MTLSHQRSNQWFSWFHFSILGLMLCAAISGCSSDADNMVGVAGQITFDGQPVEVGEIRFTVKGYATEASRIEMGKYEARVPKGTADVAIFAYRPVKENQIAVTGTAPMNENYIPAKYNVQTTLTADLAQANKGLDFALSP